MATAGVRAELISVDKLNASIDKAIALAAKRHGVEFESETMAINWEIFGRMVRKLPEENLVSQLDMAKTVMAGMGRKSSFPIAIGYGRGILVGFWDPSIRDGLGR